MSSYTVRYSEVAYTRRRYLGLPVNHSDRLHHTGSNYISISSYRNISFLCYEKAAQTRVVSIQILTAMRGTVKIISPR